MTIKVHKVDESVYETLIEVFKQEILWQHGKRINQKLLDEIREELFSYAKNSLFDGSVQ